MKLVSRIIIEEFEYVGSTNDIVKDWILKSNVELEEKGSNEKGEKEIYVVRADKQYKGRGASGHAWVSQKGGLFMSAGSLMHEKGISEDFAIQVTDHVIQVLKKTYTIEVKRKGINDIFHGNKKLGGILVENVFRGDLLVGVVIGIGLNITNPTAEFEEYFSTSFSEIGIDTSVHDVFYNILPLFMDLL